MIRKTILFLLLFSTFAYAQFGGNAPFPDNIVVRDDGTDISGAGKILDFLTGLSVEYDAATGAYQITGTATGGGSGGYIGVEEGDADVNSEVSFDTVDFGLGFDVTESPDKEANVALDLGEVMSGGATSDSTNTIYLNEADPVYAAWIAGPPNVSEFTNDSSYLTVEDDPQVGGVTADSVCQGNGATVNCDVDTSAWDKDASNDVTASTDLSDTADLLRTTDIGTSVLAPDGDGASLTNVIHVEDDPKIGGATADSVCQSNGFQINCDLDVWTEAENTAAGYTSTADEVGAVTLNKWCIGDGSAVQCTEDAPAGSGDITSVGDCLDGACLATGGNITADSVTSTLFTGALTGNVTGNADTATALSGGEQDPQVGGVTADSVCQANGTTVDCNLTKDGSGACAAGSVCTGGHTHTVGITRCASIENLAAADDNFLMTSDKIDPTITEVWCFCNGTCTTMAQFALEDQAGNAFTMATPTCATTGAATAATVTTDTVSAYEAVRWDVTNAVSPETDEYMICIHYIETSG